MTSMTTRPWFFLSVLTLLFTSCAQVVKAPDLPQSVSPGWRLNSMREVAPHTAWQAEYSGPGQAHVRIWATHGSAEGLDRMQKWQAQANTVVFYGEHYFAAVDWQAVDRAQATSLVRAVEQAIGFQPTAR